MPTVDALKTRSIDVVVEVPVARSFRVEQMAGAFDMQVEKKARREFHVELPELGGDWQIGAIVGPSGSGKSTIAREAFGKTLYRPGDWPKDAAVLDGFGERSVKEITPTLTAVGFSSPPSWVKPYRVLSCGEQFRCDLARAMLAKSALVAFDEFTSVVDRTVAKIGSAAVAKAIRKGRVGAKRFVAVTCHYDVLEWLQPDWTLDMASGRLARGRLRRPEIRLEVAPVHRSSWVLFRHHHYLSGSLLYGSSCFAAFWDGQPAAFIAWTHGVTRRRKKGDMRVHRLVVLPDYQGIGIGTRLAEFTASIWRTLGGKALITTSHPSIVAYFIRSPLWHKRRLGMVNPMGRTGQMVRDCNKKSKDSSARTTGSFQYVGPGMARGDAESYARAKPLVFEKRESVQKAEAIVRRWPGCSLRLVARGVGVSTSCARHALDELIDSGDVVQMGRPGTADRMAFYPASPRPL